MEGRMALQIVLPGIADIPLIFMQLISIYILASTSYRLFHAARSTADESLTILSLGFSLLLVSIVLSLASFFIGDLFVFSSLILFSTYASISGYILIIACRFPKIYVEALIFPLAYYYVYGELVGLVLSTLIAIRSRSAPIIAGFLLLSASHLLRFLASIAPTPYGFIVISIAEILRTGGFLSISLGIGVHR
ncbi:MAG: hypothetical protein QXQ57_03030 [Sulfolobales archaeon]